MSVFVGWIKDNEMLMKKYCICYSYCFYVISILFTRQLLTNLLKKMYLWSMKFGGKMHILSLISRLFPALFCFVSFLFPDSSIVLVVWKGLTPLGTRVVSCFINNVFIESFAIEIVEVPFFFFFVLILQ